MDKKFVLPRLSYPTTDLAPVLSQLSVETHYNKHFKAYIDKLNELVVGTEFEESALEEIATRSSGSLSNNSGQALSHKQFFEQLTPKPTQMEPKGKLAEAIVRDFGSFNAMKAQFNSVATTLFGSGWCWLCSDLEGTLQIQPMANADHPLRHNQRPLLTFDVWEHAYYTDYLNRRADYVNALWSIIDWKIVEQRYIK